MACCFACCCDYRRIFCKTEVVVVRQVDVRGRFRSRRDPSFGRVFYPFGESLRLTIVKAFGRSILRGVRHGSVVAFGRDAVRQEVGAKKPAVKQACDLAISGGAG